MKNIILYTTLAGLLLAGCKPKLGEEKDLPAPSAADFSVVQYNDPNDPINQNSFIFTNTTPEGFMRTWDFDGGAPPSRQNVDTVFFAYAGTYNVTLQVASKGGISTITKPITIAQTSPYAAEFDIDTLDTYHYRVTVTTPNAKNQTWQLPTGETFTAPSVEFYWPFADTMKISATVTAANDGVSTRTKEVVIPTNDMSNPLINDPFLQDLTGGINDPDGKTWVLAPNGGNGGRNTLNQTEYSETDYNEWGNMFGNEFTFIFKKYQYIPKSQNVTVHGLYNNVYFGGTGVGQYEELSKVDPNHVAAPFIYYKDTVEIPTETGIKDGDMLRITRGSYWGWFVDRRDVEIVSHSPTSITIRVPYSDDPAGNPTKNPNDDWTRRYFTFVPKQ